MTTNVFMTPFWWRDAICAQVGMDVFFPDDDDVVGSCAQIKEARRICRHCPVIVDCQEALVREHDNGFGGRSFGFRAGMSARQQDNYVASGHRG